MAKTGAAKKARNPAKKTAKHSTAYALIPAMIIIVIVIAYMAVMGTAPKIPAPTTPSPSSPETNATAVNNSAGAETAQPQPNSTASSTVQSAPPRPSPAPNTSVTATISAPPPNSSGSGTVAGIQYYYASSAGRGSVSAAPSAGTSFLCESSAPCTNGIQKYSWAQDASDKWCDSYNNCGEFDSIGHQNASSCSLGPVSCPYSAQQPVALGAVGIQATQPYTPYATASSENPTLTYTVSNSTTFVVILVSCVNNSHSSCSVPTVPSGCTKLFMTAYGNETGHTIGPASVYGAVCSSQSAGVYKVSVQNYTYYAAAAYVYHH